MLGIALGVRFALELCLIIVVGWFAYLAAAGWKRLALGLGAPIILLVCWGAFLSPHRTFEIGRLPRLGLELALFGFAAAALSSRGHGQLGIILLAVWLIDKLALALLER